MPDLEMLLCDVPGLPLRLQRAVRAEGIRVKDLYCLPGRRFARMRHVGVKSLREMAEVVQAEGFPYYRWPPDRPDYLGLSDIQRRLVDANDPAALGLLLRELAKQLEWAAWHFEDGPVERPDYEAQAHATMRLVAARLLVIALKTEA